MPAPFYPHYRRRVRCASIGYQNKYHSKSVKRTRALRLTMKSIKLVSAILVPVMIGVFTVITTIQESQRAQLQSDSDMEKIERQAQLQREIDALKMKEQQEYEEKNFREVRIQNVYDTFMREMSSIVLKNHLNLTIPEIIFARAKTLATLEQIDAKRKWYLIKFLYDSQLLYANKSGMRYIDLAGADLSNVKFDADKRFARRLDLEGIRLSRLQLSNSVFENVGLHQANFQYSVLNNSNFIGVSIIEANFKNTVLENSTLDLHNLQQTSFQNSHLKLSSWSITAGSQIPGWGNIDYSNCDLSESIFQGVILKNNVNFDQTNLVHSTFSNVKFSANAIFGNVNMTMSTFSNVTLIDGYFINCSMVGAIFERSHFINTVFDHVDLRQSQFNDLSNSGNFKFINTNLVGSSLNVTSEKINLIMDSLLPNRTFKTSFTKFGVNLIENSDAEQGQCYYGTNQTSVLNTTYGWVSQNDVVQMYYKNNNWTQNIINYTHAWGVCFFSSGDFYSRNQSKSNGNVIRQEINIEQLSVLIDSRLAKFYASAYLGGFEKELSLTSMRIDFKSIQNKTTLNALVGTVTNVERRNKTTMLFRSITGIIPKNTASVEIELKFQRQKGYHGLIYGMADNLKLTIEQNLSQN